MKIGIIRYPVKLYNSGRVLRGGSEIANQYIIDGLRNLGNQVIEFMPENKERVDLIDIPAIGTPLMFQDLLKRIDEINTCDLLVTTNWFGAIIPEVKIPLITIFHSNASLVLDSIKEKNITDFENVKKWLRIVSSYGIGYNSHQDEHEKTITISEKYFAQKSCRIIAVSNFIKDSIIRLYDAKPEKIDVVLNTFEPEWQNIQIKKDFSKINLVVLTRLPSDYNGFVGKGADRIFELFEKTNGIKKTLVAGTQPGKFDRFVRDKFPSVDYYQNASRREVGEILASTNVSFHPSRCEACQLTMLEAMLMGNVVITFPVGVAEELIKSGENGFIVNSVSEAIKIIRKLEDDHKALEKISSAARKTITENMSVETIVKKYQKIFEDVIRKDKNG